MNYEQHRLKMMSRFASDQRILDIGCAHMPNRYLAGSQVVGLDLEPMQLQAPYTEHVQGDVMQAGTLPDRQFDTIMMGELIEHIERPYDLLRALRPLLAPGGRVVLSTPNPLGLPVVVAEYLCLRKFYFTSNHLFYFPPRWVWRMLEHCGYRPIRTVGCGVSVGGQYIPAFTSLSYQIIYVAQLA